MRKISKKRSTVKFQNAEVEEKLISEESILSVAMGDYARRVLHDAVDRMTSSVEGAQSWGTEDGFVQAGLIRVPIERPRVRDKNGEVPIPEYKKLQSKKEFNESVRRAVMGGLATRSFQRVGDALGNAKGLSKTQISRVSKSFADDYQRLMDQDLADIKAVIIDGVYFTSETCVVAALGVSQFGAKRLLGLWAGSTESAELMKTVMTELKNRNLNPKLFVIDGSKALKSSIEKHYSWVAIQRCQAHKRRNIIEHVGEKNEAWAHIQMTKIFKAESVDTALALGKQFAADLLKINETASRSWLEAFPETITILQIKDHDLQKTFSTTNAIESLFSSVRLITGRVKRWRSASQALYWTAGSYFRIQPNMRKVRGFKALNQLDGIAKINDDLKQQKAA
jgi:transposase-like protein